MSKNTERGIGLQDGSADGQTGRSATGGAGTVAGTAAGESSRTDRPLESPPPPVDSGPVTLLGVPFPLAARGKVTAPGHDVHLSAEGHRVANSRPVSVPEVTPGRQTAPGSGMAPFQIAGNGSASEPEGPSEPAKSSRDQTRDTVLARDVARNTGARLPNGPSEPTKAESTSSKPRRSTNPADRPTIDASPLVVDHESTDQTEMEPGKNGEMTGWTNPALRPSIALGIGIALALSITLVWAVRYSTLEEGEEEPFADESAAPKAAAVPLPPPKSPSDQVAPAEDQVGAVAAGGAGPAAAEAKVDTTPEPIRGAPDEAQDPAKPVPAETLPSTGDSAKEAARESRRTATARAHAVSAGPQRSPGEPEGATAGNNGAATARAANGKAASSNPANANPTSPPSITPSRTGGPAPGSTQPYDPDSPLPPAGE